MSEKITITPAEGTWVVRAGGAVLGESDAALELIQGDGPSVIYFPREDIAMDFLDATERTSSSREKGEARHFDIVTKSTTLTDAAYSYEAPNPGIERIAGHIAFHAGDLVTVERV